MESPVAVFSRPKIWWLAARPKTLPAAITPVIIAGGLAIGDGVFHIWSFAAALLGGILIQIGTNFANDLFDFKKSVDTSARLGPMRVTHAGLVTPTQMRNATILVFSLATFVGIYLVVRGGWPIVIIGLTSILCGILYTGGPYPLGYIGLGEIFVLIFFGFVPVGGSYYVMALKITPEAMLAGLAPGLLSVAILVVNNLRDIDTDRATGKKSLAVRFGRGFSRAEYIACVGVGVLYPLAHYFVFRTHILSLISSATIFLAFPLFRQILNPAGGSALNNTLAGTGRLLLLFGILFAAGLTL